MNSQAIADTVEDSIRELLTEYKKNPWSFITESDVVNRLYSILRGKLDFRSINIHSELRPFYRSVQAQEADDFVIKDRKEPQWNKQGRANEGAMVDLLLVDVDQRFQNEAHDKAIRDQKCKDLEYWRMLSYPVEAFRAAIELKVRVSGNIPKIENDAKKLSKIKEKNKDCRLYLVVLDCQADKERLKEIYGFETVVNKQVMVFTS